MTKRTEAIARCAAPLQMVFEHLDDQTRLAEHMSRSSVTMGGGRMSYEFDEARGKAVGAHIKMTGQAFGVRCGARSVDLACSLSLGMKWDLS